MSDDVTSDEDEVDEPASEDDEVDGVLAVVHPIGDGDVVVERAEPGEIEIG